MAQLITDYRSRPSPGGSLETRSLLPSLLASLVSAEPLPEWSAAQWAAILRAPQASARVSKVAAERAMAGAAVIERPEVARLLRWVATIWPGSLHAMAGALAGARKVQTSQRADLDAAAACVVDEIRRARSRRSPRPSRRLRVVPLDPGELRIVEPPPAPRPARSAVADALAWMLCFVDRDLRLPVASRLDIEASLSVFLDWYVDRLARSSAGSQIVPIPPSRSLSPKRRLSARLVDREMVLLVAGPPGSRRCPATQAWQRGMGYWAIVALLCWARGSDPPEPTEAARQWWTSRLHVLAAGGPEAPSAVASASRAPEAAPAHQAM